MHEVAESADARMPSESFAVGVRNVIKRARIQTPLALSQNNAVLNTTLMVESCQTIQIDR